MSEGAARIRLVPTRQTSGTAGRRTRTTAATAVVVAAAAVALACTPPPTALDDADALPYVYDQGRTWYRDFLAAPPPRAFAISPHGAVGWVGDMESRKLAMETALAVCDRYSPAPCRLYAVDEEIVWQAPSRPETDTLTVPYLNAGGREAYGKLLSHPWHRAFAVSPTGRYGWSWGQPSTEQAQTNALAACNQESNVPCRLYSVDGRVVWRDEVRDRSVEDVAAVPYLRGRAELDYERYLAATWHKAFAVSPSGRYGMAWSQPNPDEAKRKALEICESNSCEVYAVDNEIVWPGHISTPVAERPATEDSEAAQKPKPPAPDPFLGTAALSEDTLSAEHGSETQYFGGGPAGPETLPALSGGQIINRSLESASGLATSLGSQSGGGS